MLPLQQLLEIGLAPDRPALERLLTAATHDLGFAYFSGVIIRGGLRHDLPPTDFVGNPPDAYRDAMNSVDDTLRDPVMSGLMAGPMPVLYDQETYTKSGTADLWDMQAAFGFRAGVACSLHEPSHFEQFMFGLDRPDRLPTDPVGRMRLSAAVQMLTVHAQAAMQRIFTPAPAGAPVLADDELESLRWAKDGYTVWQVGDKMAISSSRARQTQRSAARKLGASTTTGAVLKCIQGGLIS